MSNPVPLCCTVSDCEIACPEWCACLPLHATVSFTIQNEYRSHRTGGIDGKEIESWTFSNIKFDRDVDNCVMFSRGGAGGGTVSYSNRRTQYRPPYDAPYCDPTCPHTCNDPWVEDTWQQATAPSALVAANAVTIFCADPCNAVPVNEFMFLKASVALVTNFTDSSGLSYTGNTLADLTFISPLSCLSTGDFSVRGLRITHYDGLFPITCIGQNICKGTCNEGWQCVGFSAPYATETFYELGFDVSDCLLAQYTDCHSCFDCAPTFPVGTFSCGCGDLSQSGGGFTWTAWHREHSVTCTVP